MRHCQDGLVICLWRRGLLSCFREEGVASEDEGFVGVASREEGLVGAVARTGFGCVADKEEVGAGAMSGLWRATMS